MRRPSAGLAEAHWVGRATRSDVLGCGAGRPLLFAPFSRWRTERGPLARIRPSESRSDAPNSQLTGGTPLARRQSPQTFEKRRRERDKKLKKEAKQQDRIWRNAEKRDAKLQAEDPEAFRKLLEQRRKDEEAWYY